MPEAAVYEDGQLVPRERYVDSSAQLGQCAIVDAIPVSEGEERSAQGELRARVTPPVGLHDPAANR
jgi:hypothetical protein